MVLSLEETRKVADKIIDGAGYLFNKSHALCYSQLAYWTAYMKARYPDKFSEVMFNHHVSDKDNLGITLTMARKLLGNPKVSLGNINNFSKDYTVKDNTITIGMRSVKGIGDAVIDKISKYRPAGGWLTFQEFMEDNLSLKLVPFGAREEGKISGLQLLIQLGVFDDIPINGSGQHYSRKTLCDIVTLLSKINDEKKKRQKEIMLKLTNDENTKLYQLLGKNNIENLIDILDIDVEEEFEEVEMINTEVQYVGFRLNEDEERQNTLISCVNDMEISHIADFDDNNQEEGKHFWSVIRSVERLKTKKGKPYANVRVDDGTSFRVWHNKLQYIEDSLLPGKVIMISLNADTFGRSLSFSRNSFMGEDDILNLYKEVSR
jgi:DNA polymerase III alpha subunit